MSAPACLVFFGVRFQIAEGDDLTALENRTDPRVVSARKAKLGVYWGNFGGEAERYLLFIGHQLANLGPENPRDVEVSVEEFESMKVNTIAALSAAGFRERPCLYIQAHPDV